MPATAQQLVARDTAAWHKEKPKKSQYLRYAAQQSGRSMIELSREIMKLQRGRGRLPLHEYVRYRVFDRDALPEDEQTRFITNDLHWAITHKVCDMSWQAATEDKWLCARLLQTSQIAVPPTLAVIDKTNRRFPETEKISSVDGFREFVLAQNGAPIFAKDNRGICSFGAFVILEGNDQQLHVKGEGWLSYQAVLDDLIGDTTYLLQPVQRNHSFFSPYTEHLSTIRLCILNDGEQIQFPFSVLKLASGDNVADSFWRPENVACNIAVDTGKITRIRSKDEFSTVDHGNHPVTGTPLIGATLPKWDEVIDMARTISTIFTPVPYQSMDIAITDNGPVLIEINTGGGFDLPQLASGRGFLTPEVLEFFNRFGYAI